MSVYGQVNGVIRHATSGEVLDGAMIFINNSSWQAVSDEEGKFILEDIQPGFFELVVYKKGYEIFQSNIRVQPGKEYRLNLTLMPRSNSKQVNVRQDDVWTGNFLRFEKAILGHSDSLDQIKIENTQSLQFEVKGGSLIAKSIIPLKVENRMLGYTMNVFLLHFESNLKNEIVTKAYISYRPIESDDPGQQSKFEINRLRRYWGSYRHFFQSLISNTTEEDGFIIGNSTDPSIQPSKLIRKGLVEGYYNIDLSDSINVSYLKQPGHVSTITTAKIIEVNAYGLLLSTNSFSVNGSMRERGIVNNLPINYFPSFSIPGRDVYWKQYYSLQEKIHVHTDRDYYYPREVIWFKAYLISRDPGWRDSLSKTLYVDLFSPEMKLIEAKSYPIKQGIAWGDFRLNDSLPAGQYYLRAYTNWMRNFGDSTWFVKVMPVLPFNKNIEWHEKEYDYPPNSLTMETDQPSYHPRQRVELRIRTLNDEGNPIKTQLSVAVVDGVESVELNNGESASSNSYRFPDFADRGNYFNQVKYFMEPGVTLQGIVKDVKGNPIEANIEIIESDNALVSMKTNSVGAFVLSGFNSTDSMEIAIMAYSKKGTEVDSIELFPREIPPMNVGIPSLPLKYRNFNALQRIQNSRQFDDAILLEEVVVKSTTLTKPVPSFQTLGYGSPDHVVKGDLVRFAPNLLMGLKGRVPGLLVTQANDGIIIRLRGQKSLMGNYEPLITLDGVPLPDANSVMSVDPYSVDRVEIINRAVPIYGSRGAGG